MTRGNHTRRRFGVLGLLLPMLGLGLGTASAHPQYALSTVNRYGKLVLGTGGGQGARLFYTLMIGDVPAHALRRDADRDGNGLLDPAEQKALAQMLMARLSPSALTLQLDGAPLALPWEPPVLSLPDARVMPLAFSCETSAPLRFSLSPGTAAGEHLLYYDDRVALDPVGDVELRIEEGPEVRVLSAWQGQSPVQAQAAPASTPRPLLFATQGPPRSSLSDRSISVRFVSEASRPISIQSRRARPIARAIFLLAGAITLMVLAVYRLRQSPRSSRRNKMDKRARLD